MAMPGKDPRLIPYGATNLGTPPELFDGLIVPNDRFYVRSNGPTPALEPAEWRLAIGGLVERPVSLSLADLQALPRRRVTAFLECAGNSRTRYDPPAEGTPWLNDAVGNAVWGGTSLVNALATAGPRDGAVEVVTQGADLAEMRRGLPLGAAFDPDVLLAWEMNGEPLPVAHGGPVRLLVPRWGGIASTKWLVGLEVIDRPHVGHYQGELYLLISAAGEKLLPVREMPAKSLIVSPREGEPLAAGELVVTGYAWSGYGGIERVEVSVDGGSSWAAATIAERAGPLAWVRFVYRFSAEPGVVELRCRATDQRGLTQPERAAWNEKGYQMNAIQAVRVSVS